MDHIDKQILALLQENADLPITDIAERVHLSTTPCWRRIQRLEELGYIQRKVALLDARKLNVGVTVFVEGQNLSDSGRREVTGPGRAYLQESANYGRTFWVGLSASF